MTAVKRSLRGRFTLIQGPPGTGKTVTGVHIAYWFSQLNFGDDPPADTPRDQTPDTAPRQVLYCGPSNKSVDVVAEYLMKIKGIRILRVYGNVIEEEEFPVPNQVKSIRQTSVHKVPKKLKPFSLHHVIRDEERSPKALLLKEYDKFFARKRKAKKKVADEIVEEYLQVIKEAERWVIRSVCDSCYYQVVLCTCCVAGSKRVRDACNNIIQCIVDECAMCLEPETLVPIHWSRADQVVLIGDHMQLQPIVKNKVAKSLGLNKSLFERFADLAFMLKQQYRMHKDICEFPSKHFYSSQLKTADSVNKREEAARVSRDFLKFWPSHSKTGYVPLVFCNVVGNEEELVVTTQEGHEKSKSNVKEKDKVVEVLNKLLAFGKDGVTENQISVLSPYRAQCHIIEKELAASGISKVSVTSIVKSQGSENDFVIISLVRSLPESQIDHEPNGGWLRENLGFVTDEHQINVALTRAKRGLCIIGNKNLLEVCEMWSYLIKHYQDKQCLVDGDDWPYK